MQSAIDTNILSALWSKEPTAKHVASLLQEAYEAGGLVICAPVHTELHAHPGANCAFIEQFLNDTGIRVDFAMGKAIWRATGDAYAAYAERRRASGGGEPKRLLVDFLVGAHALLEADQLLTLDPERYQTAFPSLSLRTL